MTDLTTFFSSQQGAMLDVLRQLVEIESPSHDPAAVNRLADHLAVAMQSQGAQVERLHQARGGDILVGRWPGGPEKPILLMAHMDTVWPLGTLAERPPYEADGKFYGPGAYDMKSGIAIALAALGGLRRLGLPLPGPAILLCTADEEIGSHASRSIIERLASQSRLVLCLEPSLPGGVLKTSRKGVGGFRVRVEGRAAHAGADHKKGVNAIAEMARHVLALQALTDYEQGTTVNVGTIQGGSVSNVVPETCTVQVDFRVSKPEEAERLLQAAADLQPHHPEAQIHVRGRLNRPPMLRDARMVQTFEKASQIAAQLGMQLQEGSTGGGSDANFTAPLGVPTLDGLGADGDGGHAITEHVLVASLPQRASLLAALVSQW
jgi:glutamate carboxypeptidase